jgi:uncharacterized protein YdaT
MPWTPADVPRHNKSVKSPKRKHQWADVADSMLERTGDEGAAIRAANAVVKKSKSKSRHSAKRSRKRS